MNENEISESRLVINAMYRALKEVEDYIEELEKAKERKRYKYERES